MDDSELVPPSRLSMTDDELEAAVERAKAGPDGLMAAIVLLEEQAQLRAIDDANFAAFAARNQPHNQADAAPQPAAEDLAVEPVLDAAAEPVAEPEVEPAYEPTSASQASSDFDALLGAAIEDDGDELFSDTDFSVTGTLAQIVDQVNEDFSKPQDELAPEIDDLDISEASTPSPAPVSAFDSAFPESASNPSEVSSESRPARSTNADSKPALRHFWVAMSLVLPSSLAALLSLETASGMGRDYQIDISHFYGLALGVLLSSVLGLLVSKGSRLGSGSTTFMSRPTFGVFGAIIAQVAPFLFKFGFIAVVLIELISRSWLVAAQVDPSVMGLSIPEPVMVLAALAIALVLLFVGKLNVWVARIAAVAIVAGIAALAVANFNLGLPVAPYNALIVLEIAIQTCVVYLVVQLVFGLVAPRVAASQSIGWFAYVAVNMLLPMVFISLLAFTRYRSEDTAFLGSVVFLVAGFVALAVLLHSTVKSLAVVFIKQAWLRYAIATLLTIGAALFVKTYLVYPPLLLIWLAVPAAATVFAVLGDQLSRRFSYHEVSLARGYGFYGRFSTLNLIGVLIGSALGLALSEGFSWSAQVVDAPYNVLGPLTGVVASALFAFVWTASVGRIRVLKQETEIEKVARRKNELAGIDEIVGLP